MTVGQLVLKIPEQLLHNKGTREFIIVDKREYEHELKIQKELKEAFEMVCSGEKEYREGKTIIARSLDEAMKKYVHKKR